jgi:two-component system sensor histidine kinase/response regulator
MAEGVVETLGVLVVDDEPGMRLGADRVLRGTRAPGLDEGAQVGFSCRMAGSLLEAREALRDSPVDLVLLDYKLPDGTGLDLLGELAALDPAPLTVMVTAYASLEMAVSATKSGAWDFLAKPFSPEELRAVARKATRHILLERRARELAEERRRVRFQFISVLSHELKAPLAVIESYLDLMRRQAMGPELANYESFMERSLERIHGMRKLILDLLDLTRLESGEKSRELQDDVDLVNVARQVLDALRPQAELRGIALSLEGPLELRLRADPGELEILLVNLAGNAVKYNRDGGEVRVCLAGTESRVTVQVRDTGIGLTAEEQGRLFGEFVRIKNEHTRHIGGSGLGLSIVKRICALYGGEVGVESESGVGSTFTAVLREGVSSAARTACGAGC